MTTDDLEKRKKMKRKKKKTLGACRPNKEGQSVGFIFVENKAMDS